VRHERRALDARLVGRERADVRALIERAAQVVTEVAEEPPAARRPARSLVEREDERLAPDSRRSEGGAECVWVGQRVASPDRRVVRRRGERRLGIGWKAPGTWPSS
jgi:hypothetical protein